MRHVPACPASQREKGEKLKPYISEPQGLADLLGLSVQRIKKAEILGGKKKNERASISTEANLMGCEGTEEKVLLPEHILFIILASQLKIKKNNN